MCLLTWDRPNLSYWYCSRVTLVDAGYGNYGLLGCAIYCDKTFLTHWFVCILQCLWGFVTYRLMYKDAAQYVSRRNNIYYYVRRVPLDVRQHYASSRISFSLRTKSLSAAFRKAHSVSQRLEDYWLALVCSRWTYLPFNSASWYYQRHLYIHYGSSRTLPFNQWKGGNHLQKNSTA